MRLARVMSLPKITPRFPDGFTTWRAGQWRDSAGTLEQEPSVVLEVRHSRSSEK
jgi:hypothetical protein